MTGNFALRNSWKRANANCYGGRQQNAAPSPCASGVQIICYAACLRGQAGVTASKFSRR
jgi:hypothetical protein